MNDLLLTINAGSSSIKFALFKVSVSKELTGIITGQIDGIPASPRFEVKDVAGVSLADRILTDEKQLDHKRSLEIICSWLTNYTGEIGKLAGIGHRVVHGGVKFSQPVFVNLDVLDELEALVPLAPLHQSHNLSAIRAFGTILPNVPQVACFDTAFHRSQPEIAQKFALPKRFFAEGVRRYGFHGLSYEYIAAILPTLDADLAEARVIAAHLGNGASLCAMRHGQSIATTMGFSPLDGLVMGTRCGSLDPGVLLYLMKQKQMDTKAIEHMLYYESGLLGVSAESGDMRELQASRKAAAKEAIALFVYRVVREIGSLSAALGGLDALVFTGGIGENSAEIRAEICRQIAWLGLELDSLANQLAAPMLSTGQSRVAVWVVKTDENLVIARHTLSLL